MQALKRQPYVSSSSDEPQALPSPNLSQLNFLHQFNDTVLIEALREWNESNDSRRAWYFVDFISIVLVCLFIPQQIWELYHQVIDSEDIAHILLTSIGLLFLLFSSFSCVVMSLINHHCDLLYVQTIAAHCSRTALCSCTFFGAIVSYAIMFLLNNVLAPDSYEQHDSWICTNYPGGASKCFSLGSHICGMYMVFLVFYVLCPCLRIEFVWSMLAIDVIVAAIAIALLNDPTTQLLSFLFWTACAYMVILDTHLRNISLFLLHKQDVQETVELTSSLKHTIANVAHDLKTPLSSFSNAVEMVQTLWEDIVEAMQREDQSTVHERGRQLVDCLKNIQCTNSFMTMAINRCLDATKASSNLKLTAKNASVNLMSAVNLPLDIMRNVQQKIALHLELDTSMLHGRVASHILTDNHWLQENLLCLLSNAVKYSGHGKVVLRLAATPHEQDTGRISPQSTTRFPFQSDFEANIVISGAASMEEVPEREKAGVKDRNVRLEKGDSATVLGRSNSSSPSAHETDIRYLVFEVEDEGIGISEEARRKLFLPFQQSQRLAGGTGLGLYSLTKRMEALGGHYGVQGRRDGKPGSLFWFSIPYRPDLMMSQGASVLEEDLRTYPCRSESSEKGLGRAEPDSIILRGLSSYPLRPIKSFRESGTKTIQPRAGDAVNVLLVDDCASILKVTNLMMNRLGLTVTTASNGVEALDALEARAQPFDVVFMDLQMPVMDGLEAIRRIRSHSDPRIHGIPIIGLSANADADTRQVALEAGASKFLPKPLTMAAIAAIRQDLPQIRLGV